MGRQNRRLCTFDQTRYVPGSAFRLEWSGAEVLWWPVCKTVQLPEKGPSEGRILAWI